MFEHPLADVHGVKSEFAGGDEEEKVISGLELLTVKGRNGEKVNKNFRSEIKRHGLLAHVDYRTQPVIVSNDARETRARITRTVSTTPETNSLISIRASTRHGNEFLARLLVQAIAHGHVVSPPRRR